MVAGQIFHQQQLYRLPKFQEIGNFWKLSWLSKIQFIHEMSLKLICKFISSINIHPNSLNFSSTESHA